MFNDFRKDVAAMVGGASGPRTIVRAMVFPNVRAVAYYRVGHWLASHHMLPLAYLLRFRALRTTGADINPRAVIGPGFNLVHTSGVVIGGDVVIGSNVTIYQGVTLGTGKVPGMPSIHRGALISAGSKVLGGISIREGFVVGPNDVVMWSPLYTGGPVKYPRQVYVSVSDFPNAPEQPVVTQEFSAVEVQWDEG